MSLKDALRGIQSSREEAPAPPAKSIAAPIALGKTGKSSHPEYEAVKVYVRSKTRKAAWRKWEDAEGGDFSDLVQELLEQYLRT